MNLAYTTNEFATHQPCVLEILNATTGNILELGCGEGSTMMFRNFISDTRKLVSIESDKNWLNKYLHLQNDNHQLYYVNAGNENTLQTGQAWVDFIETTLKDMTFDIVFIDQSPWTSRFSTLKYFMNRAKYIIVHDVDYFPRISHQMGKVVNEYITSIGQTRYTMDFSDIAKQFYVYYPTEKYTYPLSIPTLICSNIATKDEFDLMVQTIEGNKAKYYN